MIPRIIHQTWKDAAVPAVFAGLTDSWKRLHPGWEFKFWTDSDLARFVDTRYPALSDLFHAYPHAIMRADLGRYLVLREFGGVYADLDTEAVTSFNTLGETLVPVFGFEPSSHLASEFIQNRGFSNVVSNAVIVSPPHHSFWDRLIGLLQRCRYATSPLDATGPFVLTAAVEQAHTAAAARVLPAHVFSSRDKFGAVVERDGSREPSLAIHYWAGTWWKPPPTGGAAEQLSPARPEAIETREFAPLGPADEDYLRSMSPSIRTERADRKDQVLVAIPVRDAADTLPALFDGLRDLRYPRASLSLAFLEGDSEDDSLERLLEFKRAYAAEFRRIDVIKHDDGVQTPTPRWDPPMQRSRRSHIARVRNRLIDRALQDEDWMLWIDADIVRFPNDIVHTLLSTGARIVHPNAVRTPGAMSMDLNAWATERHLHFDGMTPWIKDGLYQPPVSHGRLYLSDLRYRDTVPLETVGGTMLLVDADLHRAGLRFPEQPYRYLIETEGFGMAAYDLGILVLGLPNVEVIHAAR